MGKRPEDRLEELATSRFGFGTALSIDKDQDGIKARVWDARGTLTLETCGATKVDALRKLRALLEKEKHE